MRWSRACVFRLVAPKSASDPINGRRALEATVDRIDSALHPKVVACRGCGIYVGAVDAHRRRPQKPEPLRFVVVGNAYEPHMGCRPRGRNRFARALERYVPVGTPLQHEDSTCTSFMVAPLFRSVASLHIRGR
jgi:hypothetical protein